VTDSRIRKGARSASWLWSPPLLLGRIKYKTKEKCIALKCSANTFGLSLFKKHYHLFMFPLYISINFPYLRGRNSAWISSLISENQCSMVLTFNFNICPLHVLKVLICAVDNCDVTFLSHLISLFVSKDWVLLIILLEELSRFFVFV